MIAKRNIQFAELVDNVISYGNNKKFFQRGVLQLENIIMVDIS